MIQSLESRLSDFSSYNGKETDFSASQSAGISLSQSKSMELVLYTREGDKVTLSSSSQMQADELTYAGMARSGKALVRQQGEAFQMKADTQFSVTVQGDLNAKETADVKKAVGVIGNIMKDLISGNDAAMAKDAGKLGQLDSLQGLSANLHYQRQIVYQQPARMSAASGGSTSLPAGGTTTGASKSPEATAVNGIMATIKASRVSPDKWKNILTPYFSSLEEKSTARHPHDPAPSAMIHRVQSALFHHLGRMGSSGAKPS